MTKCKTLALVTAITGCMGLGCWWIGDAAASDFTQPHPLAASPVALLSMPETPAEPGHEEDRHAAHADHQKQDRKHRDHQDHKHAQETIVGSGNLKTESRPVSGFTSIQLLNAGKLTIRQTGSDKLNLTTDDNLLSLLTTEVKDNVLVLKNAKEHVNLKPSKGIDYTIEVKALSKLDVLGAGSITVQDFSGKELEIGVQGSGTVTLEGSADKLQLSIQGAGNINADKFTAHHAEITIPGSGNVRINARDTLQATIFGAGNIHYAGDPKVSKTIRGVGNVKKMSSDKK